MQVDAFALGPFSFTGSSEVLSDREQGSGLAAQAFLRRSVS